MFYHADTCREYLKKEKKMESFNTRRDAKKRWNKTGGFVFDFKDGLPEWYIGLRFMLLTESDIADSADEDFFFGDETGIAGSIILEA